MEKTMLIMIALVAVIAIGGLLYISYQKAPEITPVFVKGPVMEAPGTLMPSDTTAPGQIKMTFANPSDTAGGKIKFSFKE